MRNKSSLLFIIFRDVIMIATFILAIGLERASGERFVMMGALFLLFIVWLHVREVFQRQLNLFIPYTFLIDIIILILLDYSSKFVVNYYINVYYFYVLIAAGFIQKHRQRLVVSFAVIAAAFIKYYRLTEIYNASYVLSYVFFTLMVFITVAVFFSYSKILSEQKGKLDKLNQELKYANVMLEEKNDRIKELTIFQERNRIAREIHDSVGHNLTGLIMNLDFCEKLAGVDSSKVKEHMGVCRNVARECLVEIRRSVQALKPQSVEQLPLIKSIEQLIEGSKYKFNISVSLKVQGEIFKTAPDFNIAVYRAVQEAITNSVRHGNATGVEILIGFDEKSFTVFIKDNGKGTKKLDMGNGLNGMVERISEFNGEIGFFKNDGFMINISVPAAGIKVEEE